MTRDAGATRGADAALWAFLAAATFLFAGWGLVPDNGLYTAMLPPARLLAVGSVVKMTLLALAALWAFRCRAAVDPGNPVRPAYALLAGGMAATLAGQALLAPYQIFGGKTPFPSAADVFYVAAYPMLALSLIRFVTAYAESGYPIGSQGERAVVLGVAAVTCAALGVVVLRPVLAAPGMAPLEMGLTAAYPALDFVLLVPLALLLRVSLRFRGGQLGAAWLLVLSGVVFMCAADVLFAYFTALGRTGLDPFVHATFILAYGLIAAGVRRHLALVAA